MSITDRIARGVKVTLVADLISVAANGLLIVVLARYLLTSEEYGLLFFAISVLGVVTFFGSLGLPSSVARYVTEYVETEPEQVPHVIAASLIVLVVLATVVGGIASLSSPWIARLLNEPGLEPLLVLSIGFVLFQALRVLLVKTFQGFNRVDCSAVVNTTCAVGRTAFTVGFVALGFGIVGALTGYVIGTSVAVVVGLGILYFSFYRTFDRAPRREDGMARKILAYSIPLTATRGAGIIDKRIDTILIGVLLTPGAVAFYTIAKQVSNVCVAPARALGFTITPTYGEQKINDQHQRAARLYEQSLGNVLLLYVPSVVGLVLVAEPMVRYLFGSQYLGAVPVIEVSSIYVLMSAINVITSDGLDYLGRARDRAIVKSVAAIANVLLNLLLIPIFAVVGAAAATVVTYSAYTSVNLYIISQELPIRFGPAVRTAVGVSVISLLMGIGVYLLLPFVSGPLMLMGVIAFGVLVWAVCAVFGGLLDVRRAVQFLT